MTLNHHQREYVQFLHEQPLETLCWCGWYLAAECGAWCSRSGKGLTAADKVRESCVECGSSPFEPGGSVSHNRACSARSDEH
jgi:hypothetical protein